MDILIRTLLFASIACAVVSCTEQKNDVAVQVPLRDPALYQDLATIMFNNLPEQDLDLSKSYDAIAYSFPVPENGLRPFDGDVEKFHTYFCKNHEEARNDPNFYALSEKLFQSVSAPSTRLGKEGLKGLGENYKYYSGFPKYDEVAWIDQNLGAYYRMSDFGVLEEEGRYIVLVIVDHIPNPWSASKGGRIMVWEIDKRLTDANLLYKLPLWFSTYGGKMDIITDAASQTGS